MKIGFHPHLSVQRGFIFLLSYSIVIGTEVGDFCSVIVAYLESRVRSLRPSIENAEGCPNLFLEHIVTGGVGCLQLRREIATTKIFFSTTARKGIRSLPLHKDRLLDH